MGLMKRLLGGGRTDAKGARRPAWMKDGMSATLLEGSESLEVKGESFHQDALRLIVRQAGREVHALLVPEPDNPYDSNAVSVWVNGHKVGHLSREDAPRYQPAVTRLMREEGQPIAVAAKIYGGDRPDRSSFGIWLYHDPEDFGLRRSDAAHRTARESGGVLTGTAAGDLAWEDRLPSDRLAAINKLREWLASETDPIDRHFMFNELESLLYKCRDVFDSALSEFEATCRSHDAEMDAIRPALIERLDGVPMLPTYRQAAIMHQKAHDYESALQWAERGLALYGREAVRADAVEDLEKRAAKYRAKLTQN